MEKFLSDDKQENENIKNLKYAIKVSNEFIKELDTIKNNIF